MNRFTGKSVYNGIAIGPIAVVRKKNGPVKHETIENPEVEAARVQTAIEKTKEQLQSLYEKALEEAGESSAMIFAVHQMMLDDEAFLDSVYNTIRTEHTNAEYAVEMTGASLAELFASMDDEYMSARAADIKDISERLVQNLTGVCDENGMVMEPSIIVADDLTPSETIRMDKSKILAFVTVHGSKNSHTAILARMMNIPAMIGVPLDLEMLQDGMTAVVDTYEETVMIAPDEEILAEAKVKLDGELEKKRLLLELKGKENVTLDGTRIEVFANISGVNDVQDVLDNDAGGIGLFRSEFLYLGRETAPTEEEQFEVYKQVLQAMGEKKVVIRTLDVGADKQADYLGLEKEENPALGCRGIRICLKQPEMFRTRLRALFRAAAYGNLSILYPMITSTDEVIRIQEIVEDVKRELDASGIPYRIPEQGIMIETPASVMISDELAEMVDFFSIGTNDLTQYTLAMDRQNAALDEFYDPHHKAILRMIKIAVENAHKAGKWAAICGELGGDLELTEEFVRMGVDELSVAPAMVLPVRKRVRELKLTK